MIGVTRITGVLGMVMMILLTPPKRFILDRKMSQSWDISHFDFLYIFFHWITGKFLCRFISNIKVFHAPNLIIGFKKWTKSIEGLHFSHIIIWNWYKYLCKLGTTDCKDNPFHFLFRNYKDRILNMRDWNEHVCKISEWQWNINH